MNSLQPADIFRVVADLGRDGVPFALATVLAAQGPTPCGAGAKAIVHADGTISGTVGGGAVEAETRRQAAIAIDTQRSVAFDFNLDGTDAAEAVPVCGGRMRVLVDPTATMHCDVYGAVATATERRQRGVVVTKIDSSPTGTFVHVTFLTEEDLEDQSETSQAAGCRAVLDRQQPAFFAGQPGPVGQSDAFVDPVLPTPQLLILGAGHVGRAVAHQACQVGFDVVVIDDRPECAQQNGFPENIAVRCGAIGDELQQCSLTPETYVVIVTRNHQQDAAALAFCLPHEVAYIGMIGSRRKVAFITQQFVDAGQATIAEMERVYAPIGLDIGAATVPEIAASIVAQLISVRRCGSAPRISTR